MLRNLKITVEVDPALARTMSPEQRERLARGVRVSTCYGGVRVDGLPGMSRYGIPVFASSSDAVLFLHELADVQAGCVVRASLGNTATGRWMLDRAAFLRLAAGELVRRQAQLWPAEAA